MRINKYLALATGMSRRAADTAVEQGRAAINGTPAETGSIVHESDQVSFDGKPVSLPSLTTIMLHKPVGYVVSREGQGSKTVYDLLPAAYSRLKPVGRLDKDSSGLLLLTDDGDLANQLTHPRYAKDKVYEVTIDKPLLPADIRKLEQGIAIDDYISRLRLASMSDDKQRWRVTMSMGKNRQIRRTFMSLGYKVTALHRTQFGTYKLDDLKSGKFKEIVVKLSK